MKITKARRKFRNPFSKYFCSCANAWKMQICSASFCCLLSHLFWNYGRARGRDVWKEGVNSILAPLVVRERRGHLDGRATRGSDSQKQKGLPSPSLSSPSPQSSFCLVLPPASFSFLLFLSLFPFPLSVCQTQASARVRANFFCLHPLFSRPEGFYDV